jgi:nucleoside-diphosphate-sugar epimerase
MTEGAATQASTRIFLAGASGVIGVRLLPLLVKAGHVVAGMTRAPQKAARLRSLGAEPVVCDVFEREALIAAVRGFRADAIIDELTDLPDEAAQINEFRHRNDRMRVEGTLNLLAAASAAHVHRIVSQSIAWEHPDERARAAVEAHEHAVLSADGVIIRYGQLYGPDTFYPDEPPPPPRIHVDDAARRTIPALDAPPKSILAIVEISTDSRRSPLAEGG